MLDVGLYQHGLRRFIQLRWLASIALAGILLAGHLRGLDFDFVLPLALACLIPASNIVHMYVAKRPTGARGALLAQFAADLLLLTLLLGALGGVDGPVLFLYLLHVLLAVIFLERRDAARVLAVAAALAGLLVTLQLLDAPPLRHGHGYYSAFLGIEPPLDGRPMFVIGQAIMVVTITAILLSLILPVVHESRQHRAHLEVSEQRARDQAAVVENLLDNIGAMMMVLDKDHRMVWLNRGLRARFPTFTVGAERRCYDPAAPMGRGDPPKCPTCRVIETGKAWRGDFTLAQAGGEATILRVYATPISDGAAVGSIVELILDVTEERRGEHQLLEARRNAAVTTLAAGVAHELNTPLASLAVGLHTLRKAYDRCDRTATDPDARSSLLINDLAAQTTRCQQITESILAYSRQVRSRLVRADLESIFRAALADLSSRRRVSGIEIVVANPSRELPTVQCDPDQLRIALLNILTNAVDALRDAEREKPRIHVEVTQSAVAGMIEIHVRDNGKGMPPEVADHVFEPFYSTKPVGEGTGLGLPVSAGLVAGMQGNLAIDSAPDAGTHVVLSLHAAADDDAGHLVGDGAALGSQHGP